MTYLENKQGKRFKVVGAVNITGKSLVKVYDESKEEHFLVKESQIDTGDFLLDKKVVAEKFSNIVAKHTRSGKVVHIESDKDLRAFVKANSMDFEAVESVLDGKAMTHRKWGFEYED